MVHLDSESIDRCLDLVQRAIGGDPSLAEDFRASRRDFFSGEGARSAAGDEAALAERRHLEWFLAERSGIGVHEDRIAALLERCSAESDVDAAELTAALGASHASLFEVTGAESGRGMTLWDLAGLFECEAVESEGSRRLAVGDLVAGRVFPIGERLYHVSRAAASWRNAKLLAAIRADFERVRAERPPTARGASRLRQPEIEAMFHARTRGLEPGVGRRPLAVSRARDLLLASGLSPEDAGEVLQGLAREGPDPGRILPGGRDVLGEILDTLAFETTVDLDAARAVLLEAWDELHAEPSRPAAVAGRDPASGPALDVGTAIAKFDRKRREGAPLDQAIRELERDLDLDPDEGSDDLEEAEDLVPDFPGVVDAMVEEFLWEEGRECGPDAALRYGSLRGLGRSAADVTLFESLGPRDLIDFSCRWSIEAGDLRDPEDAEVLLEGLARFCRWAEENHDVPLETGFAPVLEDLRESLPRLSRANRACPRDAAADRGSWYEFVLSPGPGRAVLDDMAGESADYPLDARILEHLRPGDLVRAHAEKRGAITVSSCHPALLKTALEG